MDSNYGRESPCVDNSSCCSDDTVLSVGNENPLVESENLSFKNIESHLNAISKITNSTLDPESSRKSSSSPLSQRLSPVSNRSFSGSPGFAYRPLEQSNPTSPESTFRPSISPSSPNSQRVLYNSGPDSPESVTNKSPNESRPFFFRSSETKSCRNSTNTTTSNGDAGNASLKFSIDNILKADFGRRITDPIHIRKTKPKKVTVEGQKSYDEAKIGPVDLSKTDQQNEKSSDGGKTEGNQPMLWPAWVYCTRYSDRPSSGRIVVLNSVNITCI